MKEKLYRNPDERMLSGVLAGLSDYFGLDPALWRLAFLFSLIISGGAMLIVYLAAWILIPARPKIMPLSKEDYIVR